MKKQGFTLIELMVVIVIMGILAAVAVPKLFGMFAKSKASEVPTTAGTWINMQDAYFQESNHLGGWGDIGYSAPGTRTNTSSYSSNVFSYSTTTADGVTTTASANWVAVPTTKLNDCAANTANAWVLTATIGATDGTATAAQYVPTGVAACTQLTASWSGLSRASGNGN
ncbi:prepilin-type N-terminal cleavage/methylation domain-containing protein [Fibrobacter sp.]|uniref:type IV pilin protein n=1 Tax=Fibrobacter sp. TaxID=35828 RepID=UPI0025BBFBCC|nr:prepilin-type N-terminal cleavage/methylation domain-containing protein [Fibrobacter sp.]MBR4008505.1 prepilin-type N-terminal cleavage/methylation domain-containing protein [Fibrobacter sp.]